MGEGGGIGRRARLRGVWFIPCEFKSRPSHQVNIAGWCNGSTSDSDSLCTGSNPVPAAKNPHTKVCGFYVFTQFFVHKRLWEDIKWKHYYIQ